MSYYYGGWGSYKQPTIAELRSKSDRLIRARRKAGVDMHPVPAVNGNKIAKSWWGNAWCTNLERYADFANRIGRGKKYVKSGAVVDLDIQPGEVNAEVIGSGNSIYRVVVEIDPIPAENKKAILDRCVNRIDNVDELLKGKFPEDMQELFTAHNGLFPSPREIRLGCTCPDSAVMCKHVAATLYGIGVRFDEDPLLFFKLRGIEADDLVRKALDGRIESMLANAHKPSERIMDDASLHEVFGL